MSLQLIGKGEIYEPTGEILENGFPKVWQGYEVDDEDIQDLLKGKEVKLTLESGENVIGLLVKEAYRGSFIWHFKKGIPLMTQNHAWKKEEREALYRGEMVTIDSFWNTKKACKFTATAVWTGDEIVLLFD